MRVLVIGLLLAFVGCDFDSSPMVETVENRCSGEGSCAEGVCSGDICIDSAGSSIEVTVEILKDGQNETSSIPSSWAFAPERFTGPSVRDWTLPTTREVRGTVRWDGARVPAKLRFVRRMPSSVDPLPPVPVEVDTTRVTSAADEQLSFDFSARLVAGETYDLIVLPTEDAVVSPQRTEAPAIRSLPPLYLEVTVDAASIDPLRYDIEFPDAISFVCDSVESTGCSLQGQVLTFDGEVDVPAAGLQVRAVDVETGLVVSSVAQTTNSGRFAIRLGPDVTDYYIRITPSVGGLPFPAVSVVPAIVFSEINPAKVIRIPRLESVQYKGIVRDEAGGAVAGANLRFVSTGVFDDSELGLLGSFSGSASTNEDGTFGVALLPGVYSLQVIPPEEVETAWGVLATEVTVVEQMDDAEAFVVPEKVELIGGVTTFDGMPAPGLNVLARARQSEDSGGMNRSQEVATDSEGDFLMQMDRGLYELRITTAHESGYGWIVQPELVIEESVVRSYALAPPVPVEGSVLSADGEPVPGARLRAYAFAGEGDERRLLQVAETLTDEEGRYRLLVAPRLAD